MLSGDASGAVYIPSMTSFVFATTNVATAAPTGYLRFPKSTQLQTPIMGAIGVSGPYVFMQYGIDVLSSLDEVKFGSSDQAVGNDQVSLNAQTKITFRVNGLSQISEAVRRSVEIGRDPVTSAPYLGIYGPSGTTGMMAMRVQSGAGISYTLNFPAQAPGATGSVLTSDPSGNLKWIPGLINVLNEGVTLGSFQSINFQGGLNGTINPITNVLNLNDLGSFVQVGVTGLGVSGACQLASGAMVQWNVENTIMNKNSLGHTTIGTAAGWVTTRNSAFYSINSNINFTGLPSGVVMHVEQRLGATGTNSSGTPIAQSVAYLQTFAGASAGMIINSINKSYTVYVPSGVSISTWIRYLQVSSAGKAGGGSPVFLSPTGTYFEVRTIGD
jgi:hypothetical protein